MTNTGKWLEQLVSSLERDYLPEGFDVETRNKIFNDDGVQIAEFDIIITGEVGSTPVKLLIECRDRPSEGPAPGSWIEQLHGRYVRFDFDKVVAVSTTGFSPGARQFVENRNIRILLREIRQLDEITEDEVMDWLILKEFINVLYHAKLEGKCKIIVYEKDGDEGEGPIFPSTVLETLNKDAMNAPVFIRHSDGKPSTLNDLYRIWTREYPQFFKGVPQDGTKERRYVKLNFQKGLLYIQTVAGPRDIAELRLGFDIYVEKEKAHLKLTRAVAYTDTEKPLIHSSEYLTSAFGQPLNILLHNKVGSNEFHLKITKISSETSKKVK